ncbi:MAG: hypothetical protein EVA65_00905 [Oceanococcus sp.]|nr:MAG: hypothetical protein EVA65_00905 [Oceanococcus sp.]
MIKLENNELRFSFPNVHEDAECSIAFQRTLRIPDDNREYPLPAGLGHFPQFHVDDFAAKVPETWVQHGGTLLPMWQSEALWIDFGTWGSDYPCAAKIAAGKINAVSGQPWTPELQRDPQDYVVIPTQPWLDGFNVAKGLIRQFVAMPMGQGYSAEEQLTGAAEHGGIQVLVYPMKAERWEQIKRARAAEINELRDQVMFCMSASCDSAEMGLAPGGLMRQEIYDDEYGINAWDTENYSRCFVHLLNSAQFQAVTGHAPPTKPVTAAQYKAAGIPWFDYYGDGANAIGGAATLAGLKSVAAKVIEKVGKPLPNNDPLDVETTVALHPPHGTTVREGEF